MPLCVLEQMENYGYADWINDLKELYRNERVDILGTGAYYPLLTKIPSNLVEEQIILNEYGIGYYLGSHQGFEGEPSIMVKDINGFYSPNLAVNNGLLDILDKLGYKWAIVDKNSIKNTQTNSTFFKFKDKSLKVALTDSDLSNLIYKKRDLSTDDIKSVLLSKKSSDVIVICVNSDVFGYSFKDGMILLDSVMSLLNDLNLETVLVDDVYDNFGFEDLSEGVLDSTQTGNYDLWTKGSIKIQDKFWDLENILIKSTSDVPNIVGDESYSTLCLWNVAQSGIAKEHSVSIQKEILLHKFLNSEKFVLEKNIAGEDVTEVDLPAKVKYFTKVAGDFSKLLDNKKDQDSINDAVKNVESLLV